MGGPGTKQPPACSARAQLVQHDVQVDGLPALHQLVQHAPHFVPGKAHHRDVVDHLFHRDAAAAAARAGHGLWFLRRGGKLGRVRRGDWTVSMAPTPPFPSNAPHCSRDGAPLPPPPPKNPQHSRPTRRLPPAGGAARTTRSTAALGGDRNRRSTGRARRCRPARARGSRPSCWRWERRCRKAGGEGEGPHRARFPPAELEGGKTRRGF